MLLRQDTLSERNFRRLAHFIEDYSGIRMPAAKQTMVEGRLRRRAKLHGGCSLDDYCTMLFEEGGLEEEAVELIDAVTTNKTEFFREIEHFHQLVDIVLPALAGYGDRPGVDRPLEVWSAACSIGAEPYTLAMVLDDYGRHVRGYRYEVLATDICTDVLEKARLAVYPEEMADQVPDAMRRRYLMECLDPQGGTVRVVPQLRRMVKFGRLNLMDRDYPVGMLDIVFCRNILIYFDKPTQRAVLMRIASHLRPGGYLFLGHSEAGLGTGLPLKSVATSLLRQEGGA
jgi:chemotaxis protein methyltransferase CheR